MSTFVAARSSTCAATSFVSYDIMSASWSAFCSTSWSALCSTCWSASCSTCWSASCATCWSASCSTCGMVYGLVVLQAGLPDRNSTPGFKMSQSSEMCMHAWWTIMDGLVVCIRMLHVILRVIRAVVGWMHHFGWMHAGWDGWLNFG